MEALRGRPTDHGSLRRLFVLFGFLVILGFLYAHSHRSRLPVNSDYATSVLAAHDMASGNVLLDEWLLPPNTYLSTDLPIFAVLTGVFGVDPVVLHLGPAVIASGVVLVGARLALLRRKRPAWLGAGVVVVLLALPHPDLSSAFLLGPQHIGTVLFCLISFHLVATATASWTWRWWVGVAVLALAVFGDPFAVALGVAPVAVAGITRGIRLRKAAAVLPSLVVAVAAVAFGFGLSRLIRGIGGYDQARLLSLSSPGERLDNVQGLPGLFLSLLGFGPESGLDAIDRFVHGIGAAVVIVALILTVAMVVSAIVRSVLMRRPVGNLAKGIDDPWLDDALLAGFVGGVITFVLLARPPADVASSRYLTGSLIYGVVLAGRRIAGLRLEKPAAATVARAAFGVVAGAYLVSSLIAVGTTPQPRRPRVCCKVADVNHGRVLAPWLASLGLHDGFGSYWLSSITTVSSRNDVRVRSVERGKDKALHVHRFNNSLNWYQPTDRPRNFVVFVPRSGWNGIDERSAIATFGAPDGAHNFGAYRVLVWNRDLLPDLRPPIQRR